MWVGLKTDGERFLYTSETAVAAQASLNFGWKDTAEKMHVKADRAIFYGNREGIFEVQQSATACARVHVDRPDVVQFVNCASRQAFLCQYLRLET